METEAGTKPLEGVATERTGWDPPQLVLRMGPLVARAGTSNPFQYPNSILTRLLLMQAGQPVEVAELVRRTGIEHSLVQRVVYRLQVAKVIERDRHGRVRLTAVDEALRRMARWARTRPRVVVRGRIPGLDAELRLRRASFSLEEAGILHAGAGMTAAWGLGFAEPPQVARYYVERWPTREVFGALGFLEDEGPTNLELILAQDVGCLLDVQVHRGIFTPHPVQTWLDLFGQPDPEGDVAETLQREVIANEW